MREHQRHDFASGGINRRQIIQGLGCTGASLCLPINLLANHDAPLESYHPTMSLTDLEWALLKGERGKTIQKIMTTVVRYGDLFGADRLIPLDGPIHSVASFGLLFFDKMMEILDELEKEGFEVLQHFSCNPLPTDEARVPLKFIERAAFKVMFPSQKPLEKHLNRLGLDKAKSFTCACYQKEVGQVPNRGDILCWSESSAVSFANSVLGARSNRNSGILDFFCGILGKTPSFGLLTDEGRKARHLIDVQTSKAPDPWVLGAILGQEVFDGVPYIRGLDRWFAHEAKEDFHDFCKDLGAAAASYGSVGLYHLDGLTPEALDFGLDLLQGSVNPVVVDDARLAAMTAVMKAGLKEVGRIKLCMIGCPHNSLNQIKHWARSFENALSKSWRTKLAIRTILVAAPQTIGILERETDLMERLNRVGAEVGSLCALMHSQNPVIKSGGRILTNSSKLDYYSEAVFAPESVILEALTKGGLA